MVKLRSLKPKTFKFEKGEIWDGDEMIIHYIEDLLLDDLSRIKRKTYISIHCVVEKENKK